MKKTVQIDEKLINIVKVVAEAENMTIGQYVEKAIENQLASNSPKNGRTILKRGPIELQISHEE